MASKIIGRFKCMCGFESAHVKESEKCIYHYCPSCGMNGPHAKTDEQKANMRRAMRPEHSQPSPTPTPTDTPAPAEATPTPTQATPTPTEPPKRRGLF